MNGTKPQQANEVCKAGILNRGAVRKCQGCHQIFTTLHFIHVLSLRLSQIVIFRQARVVPKIF